MAALGLVRNLRWREREKNKKKKQSSTIGGYNLGHTPSHDVEDVRTFQIPS